MHILPYIEYQITSSKSPEEIADILQSVTDSDNTFLCHSSKEFLGAVRPNGFKIVSNINYRNSFLPVIKGTVHQNGTSSIINIKMQLSLMIRIFLYFWLGTLIFPFLSYCSIILYFKCRNLECSLLFPFSLSLPPLWHELVFTLLQNGQYNVWTNLSALKRVQIPLSCWKSTAAVHGKIQTLQPRIKAPNTPAPQKISAHQTPS